VFVVRIGHLAKSEVLMRGRACGFRRDERLGEALGLLDLIYLVSLVHFVFFILIDSWQQKCL